ncbi:hypothetical protein FRB99_006495 [Tulasnella sp. 403]|nr:hypothetical protein FRB99_006495 [Tulasnella sp. 403]
MAQNSSGGSQRHPKPAIFPQVATGFLYRKGKQPKQGKPATSSPQTQKETASNGQDTRNEGSSGSQHSNLGVALEQRTSNSQSAGDTTSKPTFRHALQNPLTVDWPVVPLNVENAILACVVRLLVDVAQYHIEREKLARRGKFDRWKAKGIQRSEERKRRGKAKEQPSANETETSESTDATGNGQEKNEGAEVKAPKRKRTEESDHAEAGDTSITTNEPPLKRHKASANQPVLPTSGLSRPAVLDHLIIGLNEVTKQLEVQSFAMRNPLGTVSIPTSSQNHTLKASKQRQAPIRLIVVCRPDVDSPTMIAHFPTLVAACNSRPPSHSKAKSENPDVILVGLPYGAEATLADASGLRRLSVLAFDNATPGLDCLDSLLPSIPVLQADWLTVQPASTAPTLQKTNYVPTHIKHIRTTAPKDIRQAKKKRSEERSEAKARKAVKRLPKVVLSTQSEGQGTPGPSGSKTQT